MECECQRDCQNGIKVIFHNVLKAIQIINNITTIYILKIFNFNPCLFLVKYKLVIALLCAIVLGTTLGLIFGLKKKNGG